MSTILQIRRGTAVEWTTANPILAQAEQGYETDGLGSESAKYKIGDGVTDWNTLPYQSTDVGLTGDDIITSEGGSTTVAEDILLNNANIGTNTTNLDSHVTDVANPHNTTAEQLNLGNVDNTADLDKEVSTATQGAIDSKADQSDLDLTNTQVLNNGVSIDSLTQGQTGGLISFTTLAILQAYTDLGNNDSYKVTNDSTATNNGYYHWSGSAYIQDASLANGEVEKDNTEAVTGGKVYNINELVTNENLANSYFILNDTFVNSPSGEVIYLAGYKTIKIPVSDDLVYSFGNFEIDVTSNYSFYVGETLHSFGGSVESVNFPIENIAIPSSVDIMYISIARPSNVPSDYAEVMVSVGETILPYVPSILYTKSSVDFPFLASKLSDDNVTPSPITDENSVNLKYFNDNGLKDSDLTIVKSVNLAKITSGFVLEDTYVNASGELQTITGFKTLKIDVIDGDIVSFGNFQIDTLGHCAWYTDENPSGFISQYTTATLPIENLTVPAGVNILYVAVARASNIDSDWEFIMANVGSTLLPYVDPTDSVVAIKEYKIAGGDSVNSAQLGTDVYFSSVFTTALSLDLPSGATEPAGLNLFDAWVDTTDSTVKIKLV
tara:strand:- start:18916 stop:20739 length:1824 start_codon:yes stop_codon:yes gene_type:complete